MNREVEVFADLAGQPHLAGRLWSRANKGREGASFEYDSSWLASPFWRDGRFRSGPVGPNADEANGTEDGRAGGAKSAGAAGD